jgi:hypothetical protein
VVTGKIDVREVAARLPDEAEAVEEVAGVDQELEANEEEVEV